MEICEIVCSRCRGHSFKAEMGKYFCTDCSYELTDNDIEHILHSGVYVLAFDLMDTEKILFQCCQQTLWLADSEYKKLKICPFCGKSLS